MKKIFGAAVAMALSLLLACGALALGFYHLEIARAEEALVTFDASRAEGIYARLEKTMGIVRHVPWLFDTMRAGLKLRKSRLTYLRQDYAAILKEMELTNEDEKTLSPSLRFIRANARYRAITRDQSRDKVIRDLGQSIGDYAKVIEADPTYSDAAFNFEFLVMLRDDIAGGRRPAPFRQRGAQMLPLDQMKGVHGDEGALQGAKATQKVKVWVPKEGDEDPEKRGLLPGKGSAAKKRG
jgi:hypothetical protein